MKINFNAGPAALPQDVLAAAATAVIEYDHSGMSILSISHRGSHFTAILKEANQLVLELLGLDDSYAVMWLQGGGRLQFEMIPMNFLKEGSTAAYIDSGHWAADAMSNAPRYGNLHVAGSTKASKYRTVPEVLDIPADAAYLHLTANNTIYGTQTFSFPETSVPLIADFSSELFSRKIDYSQFSLIYAVAQKNIGPAGVTLVVAKKDFIDRPVRDLTDILSYSAMAKNNSLINTAPVFAIYTSLLNLRWIKEKGLDLIEQESLEKARMLYDYIDQSQLYNGVAEKSSRSRMNACFVLNREELTKDLVAFATARNITGIEGHRSVGGIRVSMYNAISIADVKELIVVLREFEQMHI
ncbi:3-phosphoserine/phosphohydroxythreonine transaminase [Taibaiella sp. KBW10]|uniref:3-phosphoserine/phosphohydroxythreonine transaminase n=1 Tax=Taibaiella sp. KBW10 TaxID=2153357 RepID=UPI000F5A0FEB|nr:3-phosphoserine/phosphohydroxythreonine transaminase [Taibaiella sp. KBW10]RQO29807.1 3-phosphoserine/phosphohydroxythreonine transaminase [Taibaiella sp. KBW10]